MPEMKMAFIITNFIITEMRGNLDSDDDESDEEWSD